MKQTIIPHNPADVAIDPVWLAARDDLLRSSYALTKVSNDDGYTAAGGLLQQLTRTENGMEKMRKDLTRPFMDAQRLIKRVADGANAPVLEEKARIKILAETYFREQERKRRAEEAAAMEAAKREAERQLAEHEAAVALGFEDADTEPEIALPEPPAPTIEKPVSYDMRVRRDIVFTIIDPDKVERYLCSPDNRKIREHIKHNKDGLMPKLAEGPYTIPGIEMQLETKVQSR
ncbi:MAG: hypothetical protein OEQ39_02860 [Gammaproteobacteria bacterium]|nr:hypothetical protein [Gammaproteobacteria bacterium]MDH3375890.1 hypothetical protein [Gammaproteobacteria bacterium]